MGLTTAKVILKNPRKPDMLPLEVDALADTGSVFLCIPENVRSDLELESTGRKEVIVADGRRSEVPYVGPIEVRFKNRTGFFGAIVMGNQVLLGAVPMEDMDLIVIPNTRTLDINPAHPNMAGGAVMSHFKPTAEADSQSPSPPA